MNTNTHDVFISYSTKDQKIVEGLSAYLEQNGIRCFVAFRDIPSGIVWAKSVTEAIESCKLMVVVFSENFNRSKQVDREIEMCIEDGKPILSFKIENTDFKGVKKYFLKNLNWIDAFPHPEKCFGKLYNNIIKLSPDIEAESEKRHAEPLFVKSSLSSGKFYFIIGAVAVFVAVLAFFILNNKSKNIQENDIVSAEEMLKIERQQEETEMERDESDVSLINNFESKKESVNPVPNADKPNQKENVSQTSDKKTEEVRLNYTASTILVSTSGERFEAEEGDAFEGEIEKETGTIIQGKVKDKDNNIKHLFMLKRNQ
jgi:hypothetical protein